MRNRNNNNHFKVLGVERKKNESIDKLVKRFRKKVKESEVLYTYRQNQFFEKPSKKRRKKEGLSRIRRKMEKKREKKKVNKRTRFNPEGH